MNGLKNVRLAHLVVVALMVWGAALRLDRLRGPEGRMGEDEARLMIAAAGVMKHGVPRMPSGSLYLRGVVNSYLSAASMLILGRTDRAGRLPNALLGVVIVPLLYGLGAGLAGITGGLVLAALGATNGILIHWSAQAWMTSLLAVAFCAALVPLRRGFEQDSGRMQVVAAMVTVVVVLVHELGVLLAAAAALVVVTRTMRGDVGWFKRPHTIHAALLLTAATACFLVLGMALRADTVAGATGEFRHYFGPSLSPGRLLADLDRWGCSALPILCMTAVGLVMLVRFRQTDGLLLYATLGTTAITVWVVIDKESERYGVVLLPLLWLAGAHGVRELLRNVSNRVAAGRFAHVVTPLALLAVFGPQLLADVWRARQPWTPPSSTWLQEFMALEPRPEEPILTDGAELPAWYLGRVEYWERGEHFERYTFRSGARLKHLYTGALRVHTEDDVRHIAAAHPRQYLWYIGEDEPLKQFSASARDRLLSQADLEHRTPEGYIILRIELSGLIPMSR